jgi:hypothetical protein
VRHRDGVRRSPPDAAGLRQRSGQGETANDLKAIGLMYHEYMTANNKGPEKVDDLKPFSTLAPEAYKGLVDGKYVFLYGVRLTDMPGGASNTVLAYEKDVPTKGGFVCFGDGATRQVTAQEFQGAPKAQKKTAGDSK